MSELQESQQNFVRQIDFAKILQDAKKYDDIEKAIANEIADLKAHGVERIGFVSGPIDNSDDSNPEIKRQVRIQNEENMRQNIIRLEREYGFPVLGSTDFFPYSVWKNLEETKLDPVVRSPLIKKLCRQILGSGVTDIFMIENWRTAGGSWDEYEFSEQNGIFIHDEDPQQPLSPTQQ